MTTKKFSFGSIIHDIADYEPRNLVRIVGIPKVSPYLINLVDKNLWNDYWFVEGQKLEMRYDLEQNKFYKSFNCNFKAGEIEKMDLEIKDLIQNYSKSAEKYNKEISEPFVKERKALLNKIFE